MRNILLCGLVLTSACGVKMGSNVVVGTTTFLEEVNRGNFVTTIEQKQMEVITATDKKRLQARLDEVN